LQVINWPEEQSVKIPAPYLPLEIATAIVNYLECCEFDYDFNQSIWPVHTPACVRNVQKARLISRDFLYGAAPLFGKLLSSTVLTVTPGCLKFLDHLSQNLELSSSIRTLTFGSTYIPRLKLNGRMALKQRYSEGGTLDIVNEEIFGAWDRCYKEQKKFFENGGAEKVLTRIFSQFKGLRNIRLRPNTGPLLWPTKELRLMLPTPTANLGHALIERFSKLVFDDIQFVYPIIQTALSTSNTNLESLIYTLRYHWKWRKGMLLSFFEQPTTPFSPVFGHMKMFYWTIPASPKRLMHSTQQFTTMLSLILNNAPHLKSLHLIGDKYSVPRCRGLSQFLLAAPQLELLDIEGIDIDRASLLALISNKLRKLRLCQLRASRGEDWRQVYLDIAKMTALEWLELTYGTREICLSHGTTLCHCGSVPENVFESISLDGTVVMCVGEGRWRGTQMVDKNGKAIWTYDLPSICRIDHQYRFGLPMTMSKDGSHLAGTV
jgi:hypothetical protein